MTKSWMRPAQTALLGLLLSTSLTAISSPAFARHVHHAHVRSAHKPDRMDRIEQAIAAQQAQLDSQQQTIDAQNVKLAEQDAQISDLLSQRDKLLAQASTTGPSANTLGFADRRAPQSNDWLANVHATGVAINDANPPQVRPATDGVPDQPVGEAPPVERKIQDVAALPDRVGVLTPKGHFVFEPSLQYVRTSSNRLVFRGVEIVPGIQLGVIEANDADRDSVVATAAVRYGVTRRLEVEARIPYVYRRDRVTTLAQRDETVSRTMDLRGHDIGDVEVSARYQLNEFSPGKAVFVADGRIKPPTGLGPYDVTYDEAGVAQNLATGSGFWAAEGGVTMLYPTDPAVIFASLTYLHNFPRDINKTIAGALVSRVEPGDSIGASVGFGLALNPRFSVSFGYSHNYIKSTRTEIGMAWQKSNELQVGSLIMGWSYRLNDRLTFSNNFQFGVTSDAPDMQVMFSLPVRF